jgi:hypothetical protein
MPSAVAALVKEEGIEGPRDQTLKNLLHAYGSAVKRGGDGEAEKKAVIDYVMDHGGAGCDPELVRSFTEAIAVVDTDPPTDTEELAGGAKPPMTGGGLSEIGNAVFNYMKGMCGRTAVKLEEGTEFVAGKINAANFRAEAQPPEEPPEVFGKVLAGVAAVTATGAVLTDYPARITHFMANVLRGINNDMLPGYGTMIRNAAASLSGTGDLALAAGEIALKILIGVILGILVYNARKYLVGNAAQIAIDVVNPKTYRGIFMHTIATLRSVGIEADARIRGALVTAYQTFVSEVPGAAPLNPVALGAAADKAAEDVVAAVPVVPGAAAAAAAGAGGAGAAVNPLGSAPRLSSAAAADLAAGVAALGEGARKRKIGEVKGSESEGDESEGAKGETDGETDDDSTLGEERNLATAAVATPLSKKPRIEEAGAASPAASAAFTEPSTDSGSDQPPDSEERAGGRRCRSCGNVFGKTRRAARGKKSKKSGKTAKKGGKKAVRKGSFRKGRKHSKKHRR